MNEQELTWEVSDNLQVYIDNYFSKSLVGQIKNIQSPSIAYAYTLNKSLWVHSGRSAHQHLAISSTVAIEVKSEDYDDSRYDGFYDANLAENMEGYLFNFVREINDALLYGQATSSIEEARTIRTDGILTSAQPTYLSELPVGSLQPHTPQQLGFNGVNQFAIDDDTTLIFDPQGLSVLNYFAPSLVFGKDQEGNIVKRVLLWMGAPMVDTHKLIVQSAKSRDEVLKYEDHVDKEARSNPTWIDKINVGLGNTKIYL